MKKLLVGFLLLAAVHAWAVTPVSYLVPVAFSVQFKGTGNATMTVNAEPGDSSYAAYVSGTLPTETPRLVAWFRPRQVYTAFVSGTNAGDYVMCFKAPDGYEVFIDGVETDICAGNGTGGFTGNMVHVELRPLTDPSRASAGNFSGIHLGKSVTWDIGLGGLRTGRSAGRILFKELDLVTNTPADRARLYYAVPANDSQITVIGDGPSNSVLRQILTPQTLVDIKDANPSDHTLGYTISFYGPSQLSTFVAGVYTFAGSPWRTIQVQSLVASGLTITETESTVVRKSDLTLSGTIASQVYTWTLKEGSGSTYIRTTLDQSTLPVGGGRDETVWVYTGSPAAALVQKKLYHFVAQGWKLPTTPTGTDEEVVYSVDDPDHEGTTGLRTQYIYYTNSADDGNYRRIQTVTDPTGNWTTYSYYGDFFRRGSLYQEIRPYRDRPLTATSIDPTHGRVTTYDYVADYNNRGNIVKSRDEVTESVLTARRTVSVASTNVGGVAVFTREPLDFQNGTAKEDTKIYDFYWDSSVVADLRYLPAMRMAPNAAQDSYGYGQYDASTATWYNPAVHFLNPGDIQWRTVCVHGDASAQGQIDISDFEGKTIATEKLIYNQSTADISVQDAAGNVVRKEMRVCSGSSGTTPAFTLLTWQNYTYDVAGRLTNITSSNGAVTTYTYTGGRMTNSNTDGIAMVYSFDELGRTKTAKKMGMAASGTYAVQGDIVVTNSYDGASNLTKAVTNGGTLNLTNSTAFDLAGRVTSSTAPGGYVTSNVYGSGGGSVTTTMPGGATKIATTWLDGSISQITGTAVVNEFFDYSINSSGQQVTTHRLDTSASSNVVTTIADWCGHTLSESRPSWTGTPFVKTWFYDTDALVKKTTQTGEHDTLYDYTPLGVLYRQCLLTNTSYMDPYGSERWVENNVFYTNGGSGDWFLQTERKTYATTAGSPPPQVTLSNTYERVANFTSGMRAQTHFHDIYNNFSAVTVTYDPATNTVKTDHLVSGSAKDDIQISRNGLLQSSQTTSNLVTLFTYDSLGRQTGVQDPRTGTATTSYVALTSLVDHVNDSAGVKQVQYAYDTAARVINVTNSLNKVAHYSYNNRNQKVREWGQTTYPVEYAYDGFGRQTTMTTYAGSTATFTGTNWPSSPTGGQVTTWTYDAASGLLASKTDAAGKSVTFTYTTAGQVATRTWARGVVANYSYSPINGTLSGITYTSDPAGTPAVSYIYNRLENLATVTDATGTRTLNYNLGGTLELQNEVLPSGFYGDLQISRGYATVNGKAGIYDQLSVGPSTNTVLDYNMTYGFDTYGRISSSWSYAYTYAANSDLIATISDASGNFTDTRTYNAAHNWVSSRTVSDARTGNAATFTYTPDALGQTTKVQKRGSIFGGYGTTPPATPTGLDDNYTYNDRSEVTSEIDQLGGTATALTGRNDTGSGSTGYVYDNLGNRKTTSHNANTSTYTLDTTGLNQYTQRTVPAIFDIAGTADAAATITVNGSSSGVGRQGMYFYKAQSMPNTSSAAYSVFSISDGINPAVSLPAFVAKTPETFTYDFDGNLLSDGRWDYVYDAENRLISAQTHLAMFPTPIPNTDARRLEFKYDYLGRRVEKIVKTWNTGTSSFSNTYVDTKFVYDGWNDILELNALSSLSVSRINVWGLDLSGTLQGAGGVGGLLTTASSGIQSTPVYNANGDIYGLINAADGSLAAAYEYNAFGVTVRESGVASVDNPFRYSSKYTDEETGLVYYGHRLYSPSLGRFINRDPAEETGGLNLYGFCTNNGVGHWDYLGLDSTLTSFMGYNVSGGPTVDRNTVRKDWLGSKQGGLYLQSETSRWVSVQSGTTAALSGVIQAVGGIFFAPNTSGASLIATYNALLQTLNGVAKMGTMVSSNPVDFAQMVDDNFPTGLFNAAGQQVDRKVGGTKAAGYGSALDSMTSTGGTIRSYLETKDLTTFDAVGVAGDVSNLFDQISEALFGSTQPAPSSKNRADDSDVLVLEPYKITGTKPTAATDSVRNTFSQESSDLQNRLGHPPTLDEWWNRDFTGGFPGSVGSRVQEMLRQKTVIDEANDLYRKHVASQTK